MLTTRFFAAARPKVLLHYLSLPSVDRHLRFGGVLSDASIERYVERIDFQNDAVFGVYDNELRIIGVAHIPIHGDVAELGVSVLPPFRRLGIGTALVSRAANHARGRGVACMSLYCAAENKPMLRIATSLGMRLVQTGSSTTGSVALRLQSSSATTSSRSRIT